MEEEYPEKFGEDSYRIRIQNVLIVDVDNDGENELAVHFFPHYRQSPTIVFFEIQKNGSLKRVKEGLAPGPVVPISGDYLDSHVLAEAIDFSTDDMESDDESRKSLREFGTKKFGGLVEYLNFFHADSRTGLGVYIDMTHIRKEIDGDTCEAFEFSPLISISVGLLEGGSDKKYLAALVPEFIYLYEIKAFKADGFIDKTLKIIPVPSETISLFNEDSLGYILSNGDKITIKHEF